MKKKKAVVLTDTQKNQISADLYAKMVKAAQQDDLLMQSGQPAITKVNMLPTVRRVMGLKPVINNLLDNNILQALNLWIEPKGNTLTTLSVRVAIYEILKGLPCQIDHLRASAIGKTILALRKHKAEIPENKRMLKEIMEKWCRPIFNLSSDARGANNAKETKAELAQVIKNQKLAARNNEGEEGEATFEDALAGATRKLDNGYDRVVVPRSNGFMFSVRPEYDIDESSSAPIVRPMQEKMKKKLKDLKSISSKKSFGLINVTLNGRDKA